MSLAYIHTVGPAVTVAILAQVQKARLSFCPAGPHLDSVVKAMSVMTCPCVALLQYGDGKMVFLAFALDGRPVVSYRQRGRWWWTQWSGWHGTWHSAGAQKFDVKFQFAGDESRAFIHRIECAEGGRAADGGELRNATFVMRTYLMTQRQIGDTKKGLTATRVPRDQQRFIFAGKTLKNAHTVKDKGPTVHLVLKLSEGDKTQNGGCGGSGTESTKKVESLDLSSTLAGEQLTVMRDAVELSEFQDGWCKIDEQECYMPNL
jgi:hypothetical protein